MVTLLAVACNFRTKMFSSLHVETASFAPSQASLAKTSLFVQKSDPDFGNHTYLFALHIFHLALQNILNKGLGVGRYLLLVPM